ncbi:MAG TPA: DUF6541 family protein [Gaiellaceae bacterium]|nr:DUF6541 family protein [Gaiellaceae bacterium]
MRRVPWELTALPAIGIARLLPETGWGLWARLLAATACLLLPGALVVRALTGGDRPAPVPALPPFSAALAWSLGAVFVATAVMFAVHSSLWLVLILVAAIAVAALVPALRRPSNSLLRGEKSAGNGAGLSYLPATVGVALSGLAFGVALWFLMRHLTGGDDLFHLARVRKLDELGSLSLRSVDEFRDGGLHPGYAFPLWHSFLALVARLAGVDPTGVVQHEASILVPAAFLVAWEAGAQVFRSAWGGLAVAAAQVAAFALAAGRGGSYTALALPATAGRQVLVPALIALFFAFVARPSPPALATVAVSSGTVALVHPTYALFLLLPLVGYALARAILARREVVEGLAGLAAVAVPAGAVALWLRPLAEETVSVDPSATELRRAIVHYGAQLDVFSDGSYRLAPEVVGRSGAIAVAALFAVPLAAFAARRRWAAFVLGGFGAVLLLMLVPDLFTRFADAVSISQARRAAGFVPFAFAVAGGAAVLARVLSVGALPVGLGAGIAFQLAYPGDFGYSLDQGGPALATWVALVGAGAALVAGIVLPRRFAELDRAGPVAGLTVLLAVLPVALHGFTHWDERPRTGRTLTPGLIAALRSEVPKRAVVFSDDSTSYRIAAFAPVYVANALPGHVADTKANRPYERRADARAFFRTGDLAIPHRYGATWLVLNRARSKLPLDLPVAYTDAEYVLYRLPR